MTQKTGNNRTALVTGAGNGIGLELTKRLLTDNWQVAAIVRSGLPADDPLLNEMLANGRLRVYQADLTDFGQLRETIARIKAGESRIDVLFNNAGASLEKLTYSGQGRELHYELHTVVPYILFRELKELMGRNSFRTVVNTSTNAFRMLNSFDANKLASPDSFKKLFGPYAASKLALSLWTKELAPHVAAEGFKLFSVDPGGNNTLRRGRRSGLPFIVAVMMKLFFPHPRKGASLLYKAALGTEANTRATGAYYVKGAESPLKFTDQGGKVLQLVTDIYEREFLHGGSSAS